MQEKSQRELQKTAGLNRNDIFDEKLAFQITQCSFLFDIVHKLQNLFTFLIQKVVSIPHQITLICTLDPNNIKNNFDGVLLSGQNYSHFDTQDLGTAKRILEKTWNTDFIIVCQNFVGLYY